MASFPEKLSKKLEDRRGLNALRSLPVQQNLIDFSSNDYLGFAKNTVIFEGAVALLAEKNLKLNGATGSRLISGNYDLYIEVEDTIANFHATATALVFNSGYDANVGFFSAIPQRGDYIFYDEYIHASIRDGIALSTAKGYKFKHNNVKDLQRVISRVLELEKHQGAGVEVYVVTESVFSMDGDSPDLVAFANFCEMHKLHFVVDEAHALGVFGKEGRGLVAELNIAHQVFAQIVTFGKGMGCHGAAILGSMQLKEYLVNFSRSFIYTTGLPPHSLATIYLAYQELATSASISRLKNNIKYFKNQLENLELKAFFIDSNSAIQCCVISGNEKVKNLASVLQNNNFGVKAILSPTVAKGQERLRFCLHSYNTKEEIFDVLTVLKKLMH
ncbi:aminotransferase class I/II-fold pyridoxal phosphate-dependent enzyme [Cellulophaga baltica]|uniref:aminotransferase class I/II-fold pyridoxal phosphate-dependent enzyme n=1 Tax=Cellulophaga baltica TaxID=76594 RepID=UPI00040E3B42|nr:aminotransferase class I/II-fold pyridoxal phosphate-dependent enzyme [Cellulophaga baltica]AIY12338.1 8-amino-7-oxononanoate synthase [Cellulophaga baltica NN016038]MBA6315421.1 aminotransferase class I/II-fold pyridoxal phosphate-dependent enzyme [Cellulophaga baltica]